ncbi:MAG: glycine cleavage H-protein [Phycisphaerales bacterium]|nr:glycine cleavage H-protein [Phycisphaerales bacterium]
MDCEPIQPPVDAAPAAKATPYDPAAVVIYKRNRFQSRLPKGRLYTRSHFWLEQVEPPAADGSAAALYRVGFTRFATRMLGEIVEHGFEAKPGAPVAVGQTVGWVEGFKAISDVYGVVAGTFAGGNPELDADPSRIDKDPYHAGWLYLARGTPEPNSLDVDGYISVLDATIDKMLG